ncbi:sigma-54 dependent transcriptional regulator [Terrimonas sp. NA20]|uniref:Sigma-54 dependent transcriptional regulator n=1 Tax=Terrimonas ginsenosidimutans TaxID=2908004 RepID=A0ABS9KV66_9BACT|nr:sigma-54 dependent transcriptional regulator [Terrimonas ginsenosidimutans]
MKPKILIVEDQYIEARSLNVILKAAGFFVCGIANSVSSALEAIGLQKPDIVLVDIFLKGDRTGIDLGRILQRRSIAFVYLTANSNRSILDEAKQTEPYGYMIKPFRAKDVLIMLDIALHLHSIKEKQKMGSAQSPGVIAEAPVISFRHLIGESPQFLKILELAKTVGVSGTSVLIFGESGTGKELIAKSIHDISPRSKGPFVVVNCAAIPPHLIESELFGHEKGAFTGALQKKTGKFEMAEGGTIFLDEVGELPLDLQIRFLRVLQEKEIESIGGAPRKIDVRVIAATNRVLEEEVASGRFRMDLYYRLNIFPIIMPSLRDRRTDIPLLAQYFLKKYRDIKKDAPKSFSAEAMQLLEAYDWPGNIRELENTIERTILLTKDEVIDTIVKFPVNWLLTDSSEKARPKSIMENERDHIISVLESCQWKVSGPGGAAEILKINPNTLTSRIKKLGIDKVISKRNIK